MIIMKMMMKIQYYPNVRVESGDDDDYEPQQPQQGKKKKEKNFKRMN